MQVVFLWLTWKELVFFLFEDPGVTVLVTGQVAIILSAAKFLQIKPFLWNGSVSKSFRTGRLKRELQMVQLSATRCSCTAIWWISLVSFAAITLCVASQRVFIVDDVYFVMTQSGNFWIHPRMLGSGWKWLRIVSKSGLCYWCWAFRLY